MMKASREIAQRALDGDENADDYCERLWRLIEGAALNPHHGVTRDALTEVGWDHLAVSVS